MTFSDIFFALVVLGMINLPFIIALAVFWSYRNEPVGFVSC